MSARLVYWQTMALWGLLLSLLGHGPLIQIAGAVMGLIALCFLSSYESAERKRDKS